MDRDVRIGVPIRSFSEGLSRDVERSVRFAIALFAELGAETVAIDLPHIRYGVAVYYIVATAEASSNLARYDGVRYGLRDTENADLFEMYCETRAQGFGEEVKRRIMLGTYALSAGYYDAYYRKASQVRTLIAEDFRRAFEQCDMIAGPTVPVTAFGLDEMVDDPRASTCSTSPSTRPGRHTALSILRVRRLRLPVGPSSWRHYGRADPGAAATTGDRTRFRSQAVSG